MKIAMPSEGMNINQHFGKSKTFVVATVEDKNLINIEEVSSEALMHQHEGLAGLLLQKEVSVVITGGIGQGALDALEVKGLKVIRGASGNYKDVIQSFINGTLKSKNVVCQHHHGEHPHGGHDSIL